jgi:hypothetical protein
MIVVEGRLASLTAPAMGHRAGAVDASRRIARGWTGRIRAAAGLVRRVAGMPARASLAAAVAPTVMASA